MNQVNTPIWQPSASSIEEANLTRFIKEANHQYNLNVLSYDDLHQWSLHNLQEFYTLLWDFCGLISSHKGEQKILVSPDLFNSKFFDDAMLNYAENLLST